jgi:hypothetical protein
MGTSDESQITDFFVLISEVEKITAYTTGIPRIEIYKKAITDLKTLYLGTIFAAENIGAALKRRLQIET